MWYIDEFISYLKFEKRYAQHTLTAYNDDLCQFKKFYTQTYGELSNATEIKPVIVRSWLAQFKENDISSKTIHRKASSLKSYFKYLVRQTIIDQTPFNKISLPKIAKRLPQYIEENQTHNLLTNINFAANHKAQTQKLILHLLYNTGIRRSELINLKQTDCDFYLKQIKVMGKGSKERLIPVSSPTLELIAQYQTLKTEQKLSSPTLLCSPTSEPLTPNFVYLSVKKYLCLVTTIPKKSPHILRHSFATHLANNGAELNAIKELLGHSSLASTQVYTHNTIEKLKNIHKLAHPKA